ncbi:hypothetical protein OMO38_15255 [Chryseobacterium sp. 09-1422]|uniref:Uncharacterized protein n=1 Tax=Chryseobacterium kimseyorum TaxID=2984028 RepID=A0ABT3I1F0_9FLAO|nr:hypothetical protein [Chryseobacterium kimseyorum]MCW3169882.1 hypothetical protein [Chryseobacterium kimseyorum]
MMNKFQEQEVKDFLRRKNLSTVILNEVYDHFVIQISELVQENFSFQEAFLKTKVSWQHELEMVNADVYHSKKLRELKRRFCNPGSVTSFFHQYVFL